LRASSLMAAHFLDNAFAAALTRTAQVAQFTIQQKRGGCMVSVHSSYLLRQVLLPNRVVWCGQINHTR
jgi:hypothetical protein